MNTGPGNCPKRTPFRQFGNIRVGHIVPWRVLTVCIYENIGVHGGYTPRPS